MKNTHILTGFAAALAFVALNASAAPEISSGASVNVTNNKVGKVTAGGAKGKGGNLLTKVSIDAAGATNVNSLVLNNGKIGGKVNISGNSADNVTNLGGSSVNVNSVIVGK